MEISVIAIGNTVVDSAATNVFLLPASIIEGMLNFI